MAKLTVRADQADMVAFTQRHGVQPKMVPLNLEQIFPLLVEDHTS
jgi:hypothetical protein